MLNGAGDASLAVARVNVHFAADSELRQINSRLDGKAGARSDAANVFGFESVHVGAVAVDTLADAVSGAVKEILCVAGFSDDVAGHFVHLPSADGLARADAC